MISRAIDLDPFAETIEEKIFRNAKRLCIIFAVGAVTLSALDIANIRSVGNAAALMRVNNVSVAELSAPIRAGIELITFTSDEPTAVAAIPLGNVTIASRPMGNAMPPIERQASASPRMQAAKTKPGRTPRRSPVLSPCVTRMPSNSPCHRRWRRRSRPCAPSCASTANRRRARCRRSLTDLPVPIPLGCRQAYRLKVCRHQAFPIFRRRRCQLPFRLPWCRCRAPRPACRRRRRRSA